MAIVKQGMLDWPGNDGEITSQRISRLSSSKNALGGERGYFCK